MAERLIETGFSSCPNDTFMFHGLIAGDVEVPGLRFTPAMADIEALNLRALDAGSPWWDPSCRVAPDFSARARSRNAVVPGVLQVSATTPSSKRPSEAARGIPPRAARRALPVTKLSASVVAHLSDRYTVLGAGAALGRGCGPLVVCRAGDQRLASLADLRGRSVAIPGQHTTAHLLLRTCFGEALGGDGRGLDVRIMRFEQIMPALEHGIVAAGLIIHESRFTYADHGLVELADLGALWERATGLPIPLGMICAARSLEPALIDAIEDGLRRSVELAFAEPERSRGWIREHAQELDDEVCRRHIELYVNGFSVELGGDGRAAIDELLRRGRASGFLPAGPSCWR